MIIDQLFEDNKKHISVNKLDKSGQLNESMLMEDPVYRNFKRIGSYIAERKMSEKEILQVFADAEAGMTNKDTGANRTMLGRGKDTTTKFAGNVKDSVNKILSSIQNSVPVQAVDVAYDQATDALANVAGGQKGAVMGAIKKYRNLVKQYPKTAGFAKAALVAIAGLATSGAGLPAIAGLTYALDSAIKGDKLSSVLGKGAGAAALAAAGQAAFGSNATPTNDINTVDTFNVPKVPSEVEVTDYVVKKGDTLSDIAKVNQVSVDDLMKANAGQTIVKPNGASITWNDANAFSDINAAGDYVGPGTGVQQDYRVSTAPKISNPDVLAAGQTIKIPAPTGATPYSGNVGLAGDTWNKIGAGQYPASQISTNQAAKYGLKESIKFKIIPAEELIDQRATVLNWALSESVGRKSNSLNLTTIGAYTVFENVDRYRKAIMEKAGVPGSTRPAFYRPDMPGGPGKQSKPGMIGKGLNWLDKAAGKVGGALSNFGHQFTTGVTKEKLKMDWHQAGKPSDSDQLAAWLTKQGVPEQVIVDTYSKMGIPYSSSDSNSDPEDIGDTTGFAKMGSDERYTGAELNALKAQQNAVSTIRQSPQAAAHAIMQTGGSAMLSPQTTATSATQTSPSPGATNTSRTTNGAAPGSFNATNVMQLPGMQKYAKPAAPAKGANFGASPTGYGKTTTTFKSPTAPTAPTAPTVPVGPSGTYNRKTGAAELGGKSMLAMKDLPANIQKQLQAQLEDTKKQVSNMLESVQTKTDVDQIKKYVNQQFATIELTENTVQYRKKLMDHITQVGSIRRRIHASSVSN